MDKPDKLCAGEGRKDTGPNPPGLQRGWKLHRLLIMDVISRIETFPLRILRFVPYLGQLEEGVEPNVRGLYVRPGNHT